MTDTPETVSDIQEKHEPKSIEELRKTFTTGGLSGLINIGNTCYMNSALQCLAATEIFVEYFRGSGLGDGEYKTDLKQSITKKIMDEKKKQKKDMSGDEDISEEIRSHFRKTLTYKLRNLMVVMWGTNCKITPKMFKLGLEKLQREDFRGYAQEDSSLCLLLILDQIHEETKTDVKITLKNLPVGVFEYISVKDYYSKKINDKDILDDEKIKMKEEFDEYRTKHYREDAISKCLQFWQKYLKYNHSIITDIFTGLYFSQIQCQHCKISSFNYDIFNMLSLSIPSKRDITLYDCFEHEFNSEDNLSGANKYHCEYCSEKHDAIKTTKLWHSPPRLVIHLKRFTNMGAHTSKNNSLVKFPLTGLEIKEYVCEYAYNDYIYDLYAVIMQSGSLRGGHYVAYTKNPTNNEWYLFDDSNVLHIPNDKIESRIIDSQAYVLFYKKRGSVDITKYSDDE